jgi:hypothetical protein
MIDLLNNSATNASIESMRLAFATLPEEFLRIVQTQITEELKRREPTVPKSTEPVHIEVLTGNLMTGEFNELREVQGPFTASNSTFDVDGAISALFDNAGKLIRAYTDGSLIACFDFAGSWEHVSEDEMTRMMQESFSALLACAIRKERDRRVSSTNSQGGV